MNLVNYRFALKDQPLGVPQGMYEYLFARQGMFVRAARPGLDVCIPVGAYYGKPVAGLQDIPVFSSIHASVPAWMVKQMLYNSMQADGREILFWLTYNNPRLPDFPAGVNAGKSSDWNLYIPAQHGSAGSVCPINSHDPLTQHVLIEVHSHHFMAPFFSATDDQDETGFRIYAVIGNLGPGPTIRTRIGVYGHYCEIPSSWVFDLYETGLTDASASAIDEPEYDYLQGDPESEGGQ